jgi:acetyl esterase/lipase
MKLALVALAITRAGCGGTSPDAGIDAAAPRPLTLADVVAPVTDDDRARVTAHWAAQDTSARDVQLLAEGTLAVGTVQMKYRVLEHAVAGERHVGVVLIPLALTAPAPVLVYAHGGFTGEGGFEFPVTSLGDRIPGEPLRSKLVYVIPAYRGERVKVGATNYGTPGTGLIGTTDVLDASTFLSVALADQPLRADGTRVAVLGESRGGTVALTLGRLDPRIDLVIDGFGPTDFRVALAGVDAATFAGSIAAATMDPSAPANLLTRSLVPVEDVTVAGDGSLTITAAGYDEMRRRMAVTSAIGTPLALPSTQVHHGTADTTASVEYSRALATAMAAAGRASPSDAFTYFEYAGGMHSIATLPNATTRMGDAFVRVLAP